MALSRTYGPTVHVDLAELFCDPYPVLRRLRREAPAACVPAAGRHPVTREPDDVAVDRDPEFLSSMDRTTTAPGRPPADTVRGGRPGL